MTSPISSKAIKAVIGLANDCSPSLKPLPGDATGTPATTSPIPDRALPIPATTYLIPVYHESHMSYHDHIIFDRN